jgi:Tol biopolymer transport system component
MLVFNGTLGAEQNSAVTIGNHSFDPEAVDRITRLAYSYQAQPGPNGSHNIKLIFPDGDDNRSYTRLPDVIDDGTYRSYYGPDWHPEGDKLAFEKEVCTTPDPLDPNACTSAAYRRDLVLGDLKTGPFDDANPFGVLSYPVEWYPTTGHYPASPLYAPSFSAAGNRLVCGIRNALLDGRVDLAVFDLSNGKGAYINGNGVDNIADLNWMLVSGPVWSPDGQKISFYAEHTETVISGV